MSNRRIKIIGMVIPVFVIIYFYICPPKLIKEDVRYAHVSIDDCKRCYSDLYNSQNSYGSIFSHPFWKYLKDLHDSYGARFTLYSYWQSETFTMNMIPPKYWHEFELNKDWLNIAYHGVKAEIEKPVRTDDSTFLSAYQNFQNALANMGQGG